MFTRRERLPGAPRRGPWIRRAAAAGILPIILCNGPLRSAIYRPAAPRPPIRLFAAVTASLPQGNHVKSKTGREHIVRSGETFYGIAREYRLNPETLMEANAAYTPERLPVGAVLRLPETSSSRHAAPAARWRWPLRGLITSRYGKRWGRMHQGVDIASPSGTPVRAAATGRVVWAGWRGGYGLLVILEHPDGWRTAYGHNSRLYVSAGDLVEAGGTLAAVGRTGNATGAHLHFEIIHRGKPMDPLSLLQ